MMRQESLETRIEEHEKRIPGFLDCMLYGIAKKEKD
jgi:hypothetical protein